MVTTTKTRRTRPTRPKMTPEEAQHFDRLSVASYAAVKLQLSCDCEPYRDVFTYARWRAQGFQVKRGEKAARVTVFTPVDGAEGERELDPEDEERQESGRKRTRPWTAFVFCRHQVKPKE